MWLLLAFLLIPMIEIGLFIEVGGMIGLFPTLAIVVLTAIIGSALVRSQGGHALARIRASIDRLEDPTSDIADGAMILLAGALLLTPGFFTDALGFALLIPGVRAWVRRHVARRVALRAQTVHRRETFRDDGVTIETEYEEVTPPPRRGNSGWTRY
jgi:UPF0716 protein FxsA